MNARLMVQIDELIGQTVRGYATKGNRVTFFTESIRRPSG